MGIATLGVPVRGGTGSIVRSLGKGCMSQPGYILVPELFSKWVKGWVWDFLGYEDDRSWNDSYELTYRTRRKTVVIPFPARQAFGTKEDALMEALLRAQSWVDQNGLEKILELGKEVEIRVSLRDYPDAFTSLPFSAFGMNLGDPVRFACTGEEGTICDAVFDGQDSSHYKITYEVDRGDGLFFRTDIVSLEKTDPGNYSRVERIDGI